MTRRYISKLILTIFFVLPMVGELFADSLSQQIVDKIYANSELSHFEISVSSSSTTVTLEGSTYSEEMKLKAEEIAKSVAPNLKINNQIKIQPKDFKKLNVPEEEIKFEIKEMLTKDGLPIPNYDLKNGIVTVYGDYNNFQQVDKMFSIIQTIPGVKSIKSAVTVNSKPYLTTIEENWK